MSGHSEREHALLSPSSAKRWLHCHPSARLAETVERKSSVYADEGTLAHEMAEYALTKFIEGIYEPILDEMPVKPEHVQHPLYSLEMPEQVKKYVEFIVEKFYFLQKEAGSGVSILLEKKYDIGKYAPSCFGSCDATLISNSILEIIDLKYGSGVRVDADNNEQLMLYALGAYESLTAGQRKNMHTVRMSIAQVRLDHFPQMEMSVKDLLKWGKSIKGKAQLAYDGKGELITGDWCRFCPVKAVCKAQRDELLKDFDEAPFPELLSDDEVSELIGKIDQYKSWLESLNKYVYDEALKGKKWKGYKLIEGRSSRKITEPDKVKYELLKEYLEDEVLKIEMRGITDLEKLLGKKNFNARFGKYVKSSPGMPKLVPDNAVGNDYNPLSDFDVEE